MANNGPSDMVPPPDVYFSRNIFVPEQTTTLGPLSQIKPPRQLYNTAKSAVRALDVLMLLAKAPQGLRAHRIAKELDLSGSSTDQLLKTLVDSAYLVFDAVTKTYRPSPRTAGMGAAIASQYFPNGAIDRLLEALATSLRLPVSLFTSQGTYMQSLEVHWPEATRSSSPLEIRMLHPDSIGARIPLFGSSCGAAWLASQSDEVIAALHARCLREIGPAGRDTARVLASIERVRQEGYALGGLTMEGERCGIGIALPPAANGVVLVLSITGQLSELKSHATEFVALVREKVARTLF